MFNLIAIICLSLIFSACAESKPVANVSPVQQSAAETDVIAKTIELPYEKPGAPVVLTYEMPAQIGAGDTVDVSLIFRSGTLKGELVIAVNAGNGLILNSEANARFDLGSESKRMDVQLYVANDGLFYLNVMASEFDADSNALLGRSFAVPIQAGLTARNQKVNGQAVDDDKETIIEMPAEEG
jgi:hypothetical protein